MRRVLLALPLVLAACASPEYVARQSNWDVCRLSMGGPHSLAAEEEAARRGVDCRSMYPAIQGQEANRAASTQILLQQMQPRPVPMPPAPVTCRSARMGTTVETRCD